MKKRIQIDCHLIDEIQEVLFMVCTEVAIDRNIYKVLLNSLEESNESLCLGRLMSALIWHMEKSPL